MEKRYNLDGPKIEGLGVIALALIIILGGVLFFSLGRIGVGQVALVIDPVLGTTSAIGDGQNARFFFKSPWANVYKVYVATDSIHMWSEGGAIGDFPAVESLTRDGLRVDVDLTVRWSISPSGVPDLFRRFPGLDWKERAIIPIIRETIRDLLVDYTAIETIERRGTIAKTMEVSLEEALSTERALRESIILRGVDLRKISLPATFVKAIESKLSAEQLSIASEFNKTRLIILANATAESQILNAEGLAESRLLLANSTREAIINLARSEKGLNMSKLTKLYIYLETLRDISEKGNSQIYVISGDNGEFILPIPQSTP
jgi:regulator of protease activity HflC (stomatin/prohibitin superfamily)